MVQSLAAPDQVLLVDDWPLERLDQLVGERSKGTQGNADDLQLLWSPERHAPQPVGAKGLDAPGADPHRSPRGHRPIEVVHDEGHLPDVRPLG